MHDAERRAVVSGELVCVRRPPSASANRLRRTFCPRPGTGSAINQLKASLRVLHDGEVQLRVAHFERTMFG
jgi:hypothetical protein